MHLHYPYANIELFIDLSFKPAKMNEMLIIFILIFIFSLAILLKASDMLSDSAERIGLFFRIPKFIVGVTIVSVGTSLPELVTSIVAMFESSPEIVVSNAIGSNVTNIFLILGVATIVARKIQVSYDLIHVDLPIFIGSTFLFVLTILDQKINFFEGLLLFGGLVVYILYAVNAERRSPTRNVKKILKEEHRTRHISWKIPFTLLLSVLLIFIGARFAVEALIGVSTELNIGEEFISLTAFALGTSLPELFVAINAAKKGYSEIVVGSILGSSIFNIFGVVGIPALLGVVIVPSTVFVIIVTISLVSAFLYFFITQEKQITMWEGMLLILFYLFFMGQVTSALVT